MTYTRCSCSENWRKLKFYSISTRADGIGTNLLDHTLAIVVCDKLNLLTKYPRWVHRAGTKACFNNICGSVYHDAMRGWLEDFRRDHKDEKSGNEVGVCPPLPRTSAQKTVRGIMELQNDLVSTVRTNLMPQIQPYIDVDTRAYRPSSPAACVHYRLFDVEEKRNTLKNLMNAHDCDQFVEEMNKTHLPHVSWPLTKEKCESRYQQSSYAEDSMVAISKALSRKFPGHKQYLVGCDSNSRLQPTASTSLLRKAKRWGYDQVHCSENTSVSDKDIHFLSQCDVFVAGHSTFSVMAMAFAKSDAVIYSPVWSGSVAVGLFTKYDHSGVRPITDLLFSD